MAKEHEALLNNFEALGENYCTNFRAILGKSETAKLLDIYEPGLSQGLGGLSKMLMAKHNAMPKKDRDAQNRIVALSGVLDMVKAANKMLGEGSIDSSYTLAFASELFPKIKRFLRLMHSIEENTEEDFTLRFIDDVINNIIKFATDGAIRRPQQLPPAPDED